LPYHPAVATIGWTERQVPPQEGRVFVVTGANGGIGYHTARVLAARGARVIMACRRAEAGEEAAARLRERTPGALVELEILDLASLSSVDACARRIAARLPRLDCLINNAGIMSVPRSITADGFERQLAVNHLGHFALTGRLLPSLLVAPHPRVVTVTSAAYRMGRLHFADLQAERRYRPWQAYAASKLANLLFALELDRRARAAGAPLISVAAHPGYAATGLQVNPDRHLPAPLRRFWTWANSHVAQDAAGGALPTLRAATDPAATGGALYGPSGLLRGPAVPARLSAQARDHVAAGRLWEASQDLTGVVFSFPGTG
jgi:NAD(P)-dependent dehydrogenase (short-subunit alcohol dehydrogenase family)